MLEGEGFWILLSVCLLIHWVCYLHVLQEVCCQCGAVLASLCPFHARHPLPDDACVTLIPWDVAPSGSPCVPCLWLQ